MGDTWQYRLRVSGADRAKWKKKALADTFGGEHPHYSWPMLGKFDSGRTYPAGGFWYNVTLRETEAYVELLGNFSGTPGLYFEKKSKFADEFRHGPALFGKLDIKVEIVGHSWSCDSTTGIYSYRDVYKRGRRTKTEKSDSAAIAEQYAPELLEAFPDEHTPEERAEWAREALEYEEEEKREKAREAEAKLLTWRALRPGAFVEIRRKGNVGTHHVVERIDGDVGVFRYRLIEGDFDGAELKLNFNDDFSIERRPVYCEHGRDSRTRAVCDGCQELQRLIAQDVKYMLDGLRARVVL